MAYWIGEFIRTALAYGLVMFLWPSVVFRDHLSRHSRTYGFAFCTLFMVLMSNLTVLCLGLIPHGLNAWTVRILFYGMFLYRLAPRTVKFRASLFTKLERLSRGTIGVKSFLFRALRLLGRAFQSMGRGIRKLTRGHVAECIVLAVLCGYSVLYFSWGAFDLRSFTFSDTYVHQAWITGLTEGKIFSGGIYPEGMHTFIYLLHTVSGVSVYSLLLFTGGIHTAVLMVSVWLFLREIFHWPGTALLIVLLFLTLDQGSMNDLYMMSRLQGTIPQEFAMYAEFLGGAFLIRYLKSLKADNTKCGQISNKEEVCGRRFLRKARQRAFRILYNEDANLRLFAWSAAVTFAVHFYVTIMMALLCVAIAIPMIRQMVNRKGLPAVMKAAVFAIVITLLPMAGAFAEGHPLQGSLGWAMNVMQGAATDDETEQGKEAEQTSESPSENTVEAENSVLSDAEKVTGEAGAELSDHSDKGSRKSVYEWVRTKLQSAGQELKGIASILKNDKNKLYELGFQIVYPGNMGKIYWTVMLLALVIPVLLRILFCLIPPWRSFRSFADRYLICALASLLFMINYLASDLGLIQLIAGVRVLSSAKIFLLASGGMLPDLLSYGAINVYRKGENKIDGILLIAGVLGSLSLVIGSSHYHGYLYSGVSRYPEAVDVTNNIIHNMPQETYTIVSTTEELYQVYGGGYHEELLTLIKMDEMYPGYSIPTKCLFVYIEKTPMRYGQQYFPEGPDWLAVNEKNYLLARSFDWPASQAPSFISSSISEEEANKPLNYNIGSSMAATEFEGRTILESKAARWINTFEKYYPNACRVWYEDERFVCYQITQDPQIPYKLGFTAQQIQEQQQEGNS